MRTKSCINLTLPKLLYNILFLLHYIYLEKLLFPSYSKLHVGDSVGSKYSVISIGGLMGGLDDIILVIGGALAFSGYVFDYRRSKSKASSPSQERELSSRTCLYLKVSGY